MPGMRRRHPCRSSMSNASDSNGDRDLTSPLLGSEARRSPASSVSPILLFVRSVKLFFLRLYNRILDVFFLYYRRRVLTGQPKQSSPSSLLWLRSVWSTYTVPSESSLLQSARLTELRERAGVAYDEAMHACYLHRLWAVVFKDEAGKLPTEGVRHPLWKDLGWQSDDPGRDIRGGGVLALELLVFFAEQDNERFMVLVRKTREREIEHYYPFAAASVVVTKALVDMLELNREWDVEWTPSRSPEIEGFVTKLLPVSERALEQVFIETLLTLDEVWEERKMKYFDFNKALAEVQQRLRTILQRRWLSTPEHLGAMRWEYA